MKSSLWKRLVFCAIMLAAATIITAKLVGKSDTDAAPCCETAVSAACCAEATPAACCAEATPAACCTDSQTKK
jgi:hypothetical protein